jgi:AcrR family transcriptional regulator
MTATGKAEYRSSLRSKRLIREAFLELLGEKEKSKITVTDIVTRADINRRTFYAHYQDVRALIEMLEDETIANIDEALSEVGASYFLQNPLPLITNLTKYVGENLDYFRMLICGDDAEPFTRKLKELFIRKLRNKDGVPDSIKSGVEFEVFTHFIAGGLVNVLQMWLRVDTGYSLAEYSNALANLVTLPESGNPSILSEVLSTITATDKK